MTDEWGGAAALIASVREQRPRKARKQQALLSSFSMRFFPGVFIYRFTFSFSTFTRACQVAQADLGFSVLWGAAVQGVSCRVSSLIYKGFYVLLLHSWDSSGSRNTLVSLENDPLLDLSQKVKNC